MQIYISNCLFTGWKRPVFTIIRNTHTETVTSTTRSQNDPTINISLEASGSSIPSSTNSSLEERVKKTSEGYAEVKAAIKERARQRLEQSSSVENPNKDPVNVSTMSEATPKVSSELNSTDTSSIKSPVATNESTASPAPTAQSSQSSNQVSEESRSGSTTDASESLSENIFTSQNTDIPEKAGRVDLNLLKDTSREEKIIQATTIAHEVTGGLLQRWGALIDRTTEASKRWQIITTRSIELLRSLGPGRVALYTAGGLAIAFSIWSVVRYGQLPFRGILSTLAGGGSGASNTMGTLSSNITPSLSNNTNFSLINLPSLPTPRDLAPGVSPVAGAIGGATGHTISSILDMIGSNPIAVSIIIAGWLLGRFRR
jgi:hypothetical protein